MNSGCDVYLEFKNRVYSLSFNRKVSFIRGNSATGRTKILNYISLYNTHGGSYGVNLDSSLKCVVMNSETWMYAQQGIDFSNSIIFIDEGNRFVLSEEFASYVSKTDSYFVLMLREDIDSLAYVTCEVFELITQGNKTFNSPALRVTDNPKPQLTKMTFAIKKEERGVLKC